MTHRPSIFLRSLSTPLILILVLVAFLALATFMNSGPFNQVVIDGLVKVTLVVGLYVFIGNSGVLSFGHIGFTCLGAYATAWLTIPPLMKKMALPGLPEFILEAKLPYGLGIGFGALFAGAFALVVGKILMRLSGIAASIATFAMLAVINTVYSNWERVTGATSSVVGIPIVRVVWPYCLAAVVSIVIAHLYAISRSGLALRAARDEAIAASASGVDIGRERLIAFVISAVITGMGGALSAHSVGVVTPDTFYLNLTFICLSMLVVGGMNSLSGAVMGVVVLSVIIQVLRQFEKGVSLGGTVVSIPNGLQEIAIGIVMVVILIARPTGLTRNQEIVWQGWPFKRVSAATEP
jgi:branched-chain amino acid transport system permease protein